MGRSDNRVQRSTKYLISFFVHALFMPFFLSHAIFCLVMVLVSGSVLSFKAPSLVLKTCIDLYYLLVSLIQNQAVSFDNACIIVF